MSQFNLTHEEDQIVLDALRSKGAAYTAMFGSTEASIEALITKLESQLPAPVVVEFAPAETAVVEPEMVVETPKAKKPKAVEE